MSTRKSMPQEQLKPRSARQPHVIVQQHEVIQSSPLPPPSDMKQYEDILPGAAERVFAQFEQESRHRQEIERTAVNGNVAAQKLQLELFALQEKNSYRNNLIGQGCGLAVSVLCIAGAVYIAGSQPYVACLLAGIPTAAVIHEFFGKRTGEKTEAQKK